MLVEIRIPTFPKWGWGGVWWRVIYFWLVRFRPHPSSGLCSQQGRGWLPGSDPLHHEAFPPAGPFLLLLLLPHRFPLPRSQLVEALRHHRHLRPPAQQRPPQRLRQRPSRCTGWPGWVSVWVSSCSPTPPQSAAVTVTTTSGGLPLTWGQRDQESTHPLTHMSVMCMYVCVRVCVSVWSSLEVQSNLICN